MPFPFAFPSATFPLPDGGECTIRGTTIADVEGWRADWKPILDAKQCSDASWDWEREANRSLRDPGHLCLSLTRSSRLDAMVSLRSPEESRLEPGTMTLHVEYLAVAPWNRRELVSPAAPEVAGLGTLLLALSVRVSRRLGAGGRLSLHSLSRVPTTAFYEARGFVSTGLQTMGDLPDIYFELPQSQSLELERKLGMSP